MGNGYGSNQNNGHNRGNNGNYGSGNGGVRNNNNGNNNDNNSGGGNNGNNDIPALRKLFQEKAVSSLRNLTKEEKKAFTIVVVEQVNRNYQLRNRNVNNEQGKATSIFAKVTKSGRTNNNAAKSKDVGAKKGTKPEKTKKMEMPKLIKPVVKKQVSKPNSNCNSFMSQALSQVKISMPLLEVIKFPDYKNEALKIISNVGEMNTGAAVNIMPKDVMKELGMHVDTPYGKFYVMDKRKRQALRGYIHFIDNMEDQCRNQEVEELVDVMEDLEKRLQEKKQRLEDLQGEEEERAESKKLREAVLNITPKNEVEMKRRLKEDINAEVENMTPQKGRQLLVEASIILFPGWDLSASFNFDSLLHADNRDMKLDIQGVKHIFIGSRFNKAQLKWELFGKHKYKALYEEVLKRRGDPIPQVNDSSTQWKKEYTKELKEELKEEFQDCEEVFQNEIPSLVDDVGIIKDKNAWISKYKALLSAALSVAQEDTLDMNEAFDWLENLIKMEIALRDTIFNAVTYRDEGYLKHIRKCRKRLHAKN
ncbi:uncharacterized protein LOC131860226 [Cryptomeria japonica]|uniref:uncharacterized protein LOC131860226 n=1 Tax=Cryptomeria japonica TaxID=3369 RepID=UPI0027DA1ACF|nr:uncharacterized protein LOC131860226 [Cryptomeria japonica]